MVRISEIAEWIIWKTKYNIIHWIYGCSLKEWKDKIAHCGTHYSIVF